MTKHEGVSAFPLSWPHWVARTPAGGRRDAQFGTSKMRQSGESSYRSKDKLTVAVARERLQSEVDALGGRDAVLSTNVALNMSGQPRSDRGEPDDPGAALYFVLNGKPVCLPCDKWSRVADNIGAIAKHIDSLRGQARWGVGTVAQAFAGYEALPSPDRVDWRGVLQLHRASVMNRAIVKAAYEALAKQRHPDHGGSHEMMSDLNRARDAAFKEVPE